MKELLTEISEELAELFNNHKNFGNSYISTPLNIPERVNKIKRKNVYIAFHLRDYNNTQIYTFLSNTNNEMPLLSVKLKRPQRKKFLYEVVKSAAKRTKKFERKYKTSLGDAIIVAEIFETEAEILETLGSTDLIYLKSIWNLI